MGAITQIEIDELIYKIRQERTSIIDFEPDNLKDYDFIDPEKRKEIEKKLRDIDALYVKPLERLLDFIVTRNEDIYPILNLERHSISIRIFILKSYLYRYGYTNEQINDMIPKNEEEINIILAAREKGFNDTGVKTNDKRISEAQNYLYSKISIKRSSL